MSGLTPEEQRFFDTGDASHLQAAPAPAPAPDTPDPLALQALATAPAPAPLPEASAPAPAPAAQAPAPASAPEADPSEFLRRALADTQQRALDLEVQLRTQLAAQQQAAANKEAPPPDPSVDPIGSMMHQLNTLNRQILGLQQGMQNQAAQTQQLQQFQAFQAQVVKMRDSFMATTPDYQDAYNYIRANRAADLRGLGMAEPLIERQLLQEEVALAESSINQGRNPAQVLYEASKRHGYVPKSPAAAPSPAPAPAASLEAIQRAQAAARNPAAAAPVNNDISVDSLRTMGDADLNKTVMSKDSWDRLMGGGNDYPL